MDEKTMEHKVISTNRANEILEVIMSYARLDFTASTKINGDDDVFDAIGAGINMLGEELKVSTVSLVEKEQLLKEVHHRVKNNLQIIISLINLQSELVTDMANKESLIGFKNRIKSMALVHEMLYSSNNITKINLNGYVKNLIQHLSFTFEGDRKEIYFKVDVDDEIDYEMDKMTPLGLILNEIISNSLRHAFIDAKGEISIQVRKKDEGCVLNIRDNGKGLSSEFDIVKDSKLGMQLIQILCEQIDSSFDIRNNDGVEIEMKF